MNLAVWGSWRRFMPRGTFRVPLVMAITAGTLAGSVRLAATCDDDVDHFLAENFKFDEAAFGAFVFLVNLLIIFRVSQTYARYWEGCSLVHKLGGHLFDAYSSLIAFSRFSRLEESAKLSEYKHILMRLFGLLHAMMLADLEPGKGHTALSYELIDPHGINPDFMATASSTSCRAEFVFNTIQSFVVDSMMPAEVLSDTPAPIATRVFQDLGNCMMAYHDASKFHIKFPHVYSVATKTLLLLHWGLVPLQVLWWTKTTAWAAFFAFVQVFMLWVLHSVCHELENPFDGNGELELGSMQIRLNEMLRSTLEGDVQKKGFMRALLQKDACRDLAMLARKQESFMEVSHTLSRSGATIFRKCFSSRSRSGSAHFATDVLDDSPIEDNGIYSETQTRDDDPDNFYAIGQIGQIQLSATTGTSIMPSIEPANRSIKTDESSDSCASLLAGRPSPKHSPLPSMLPEQVDSDEACWQGPHARDPRELQLQEDRNSGVLSDERALNTGMLYQLVVPMNNG